MQKNLIAPPVGVFLLLYMTCTSSSAYEIWQEVDFQVSALNPKSTGFVYYNNLVVAPMVTTVI